LVFAKDKNYTVVGRKKLREDGLYVGDFVDFDENEKVINAVYSRKNILIRPPLSNVTQMIIVVAKKPQPDFYLVDKLLIKCFSLGINPILCVNKVDLVEEYFKNEILAQYKNVCKIIFTSAKTQEGIEELKGYLVGNLTVFAGQSAVGKSSITNIIFPEANKETGELSIKNQRGKNCTRHNEIYILPNGAMLADTAGFSAFDVDNIDAKQLCDFYPEFSKYANKCAYSTCIHIGEKEELCAIKKAVKDTTINKERYNRYCEIYKQQKLKEDKKYD